MAIDEDDLRALLHRVEPVDTTDAAGWAVRRGREVRRRRRLAAAAVALLSTGGLVTGALVAERDREPLAPVNPYATPAPEPTLPTPSGTPSATRPSPRPAPVTTAVTPPPATGLPPAPPPAPSSASAAATTTGAATTPSTPAPGTTSSTTPPPAPGRTAGSVAAPSQAATGVGVGQLPVASDLRDMGTANRPLGSATDHPAGRWDGVTMSHCRATPQLGQASLRVREYPGAQVVVAVMSFPDRAAASRARATVVEWYRTCPGSTAPDPWTGHRLPAGAGVTAVALNAAWGSDGPTAGHEEGAVVQVDSRLAWVTQQHGAEQNCSLEPSDVVGQCGAFASVDAVAARLAR